MTFLKKKENILLSKDIMNISKSKERGMTSTIKKVSKLKGKVEDIQLQNSPILQPPRQVFAPKRPSSSTCS